MLAARDEAGPGDQRGDGPSRPQGSKGPWEFLGLGFRVKHLRFRFRFKHLRFGVQGLEFRVVFRFGRVFMYRAVQQVMDGSSGLMLFYRGLRVYRVQGLRLLGSESFEKGSIDSMDFPGRLAS